MMSVGSSGGAGPQLQQGIAACFVVADVAAHSRCVVALDAHPTLPFFVSAGEDTLVHVFSLEQIRPARSEQSGNLRLLFSSRREDAMLCGVCFARDGSNRIFATAYDRDELFVWKEAI